MTFVSAIGEAITQIGSVLSLFTKEPTVYFTALAFASGAIGVSRKLIPMRRR